MIRVVTAGPLCTLQDLGRPGWAHLGVSGSGAADRGSHRLANRLVGNDESATTLEVTLGGLDFVVERHAVIAVTGAPCPISVTGGPPVGHHVATAVPGGTRVSLGVAPRGLRAYVAVRGGFLGPTQLGSSSADTLGGLGPPPLQAGDRLKVGPDPGGGLIGEPAPQRWPDAPVVTLHPGPRLDHVDAAALVRTRYQVSAEVDRVGVRLVAEHPLTVRPVELSSEGVIPGAVQVPRDGHPIVFLADHPVTGGYPVVAVVDPDHLDLVAQLRPGDHLRFTWSRR